MRIPIVTIGLALAALTASLVIPVSHITVLDTTRQAELGGRQCPDVSCSPGESNCTSMNGPGCALILEGGRCMHNCTGGAYLKQCFAIEGKRCQDTIGEAVNCGFKEWGVCISGQCVGQTTSQTACGGFNHNCNPLPDCN